MVGSAANGGVGVPLEGGNAPGRSYVFVVFGGICVGFGVFSRAGGGRLNCLDVAFIFIFHVCILEGCAMFCVTCSNSQQACMIWRHRRHRLVVGAEASFPLRWERAIETPFIVD